MLLNKKILIITPEHNQAIFNENGVLMFQKGQKYCGIDVYNMFCNYGSYIDKLQRIGLKASFNGLYLELSGTFVISKEIIEDLSEEDLYVCKGFVSRYTERLVSILGTEIVTLNNIQITNAFNNLKSAILHPDDSQITRVPTRKYQGVLLNLIKFLIENKTNPIPENEFKKSVHDIIINFKEEYNKDKNSKIKNFYKDPIAMAIMALGAILINCYRSILALLLGAAVIFSGFQATRTLIKPKENNLDLNIMSGFDGLKEAVFAPRVNT